MWGKSSVKNLEKSAEVHELLSLQFAAFSGSSGRFSLIYLLFFIILIQQLLLLSALLSS